MRSVFSRGSTRGVEDQIWALSDAEVDEDACARTTHVEAGTTRPQSGLSSYARSVCLWRARWQHHEAKPQPVTAGTLRGRMARDGA